MADVSVVLNVHREGRYIRRTLRSLGEAAAFASSHGITTELVVVFDKSDATTIEALLSCSFVDFGSVSRLHVDYGSLGMSRNAGIDAAKGDYVWLSDADDLVSFNSIVKMLTVARATPDSAVVPEFVVSFGEFQWTSRYFDDSIVSTVDFVCGHPYISRIFVRRSLLAGVRFEDLRVSEGFAYEDWHCNCQLRAHGVRFRVAPNTMMFYRQRAGSLLRQANALSVGQVPHSQLFSPLLFARSVSDEEAQQFHPGREARREVLRAADPREALLADPVAHEQIIAANKIEPAINSVGVQSGGYGCNIFPNRHWGHDYAQACAIVGDAPFTDIVLLPSVGIGGAEKYLIDVLHSLATQVNDFRCLVVAGEATRAHSWLDRLPKGTVFIDVINSFPWASDDERDLIVLRLLLATRREGTRLHLKDSAFAIRWFGKFSNAVGHLVKTAFYRFGPSRISFGSDYLELGDAFDFISSKLPHISWILGDHERIIQEDRERIGVDPGKWHCLYAKHVPEIFKRTGPPSYRLLWASRLSPEKKPWLIPAIANAIRTEFPQVTITVAGVVDDTEEARKWVRDIEKTPGVEYIGAYSGFDQLAPQNYDAFIYTSAFDGIPNVLLEAMGSGMVVIAPDVGGIREAVTNGKTGWLLNDSADEHMVRAYAHEISEIYQDFPAACQIGEAARQFVADRHSLAAHETAVAAIFLGRTLYE